MLNRGDRSPEKMSGLVLHFLLRIYYVSSVLEKVSLLRVCISFKWKAIIWITATNQYAALEPPKSQCVNSRVHFPRYYAVATSTISLKRKKNKKHHTLSWLLSFGNISVIILRTLSTHQHTIYGHWSQIKLLNHVVPFPSEISFLAQPSFLKFTVSNYIIFCCLLLVNIPTRFCYSVLILSIGEGNSMT